MLCTIQNSQHLVNSAHTWCFRDVALVLLFLPPCWWVQKGFLLNGPTAVVTFHDVHDIYTTAERNNAKWLSFSIISRGYMLMILVGELLLTFCKIVLIVMELFYDFQMICCMWQPEVFEQNLSVLLPAQPKLHAHKNSTRLMNKVVYLAAKKPGIFLWGFTGEENKAN